MKAILLTALPAALLACATTGAEQHDDLGCFDGKCDGETIWNYEAGKTPWVTCENASSKVTCGLDMTPKGVQPTQASLNKGDVPFYYPTPLTPEAPRFTLPDTFNTGEPIAILARAPTAGLGDVRKLLPAPAPGKSATYFAPFDTWRVSVTSVGANVGSLILRYSVKITGATFMLTQAIDRLVR